MKKRKVNKNFDLNKQTIAHLTDFEQERVMAGDDRCQLTYCIKSGSAVWYSSGVYFDEHTHILPPTGPWPCFIEPDTIITIPK